ncbi:ExbD/TolR family protein, partial [Pseudaquabacterium rugosum]
MASASRQRHLARRAAPAADAPVADINTTPLIDVMLVLLIMLIITIPIQLHSVDLDMPVGQPPPSDIKPEVLRIDIDALSTVLWNGEPVAPG